MAADGVRRRSRKAFARVSTADLARAPLIFKVFCGACMLERNLFASRARGVMEANFLKYAVG